MTWSRKSEAFENSSKTKYSALVILNYFFQNKNVSVVSNYEKAIKLLMFKIVSVIYRYKVSSIK